MPARGIVGPVKGKTVPVYKCTRDGPEAIYIDMQIQRQHLKRELMLSAVSLSHCIVSSAPPSRSPVTLLSSMQSSAVSVSGGRATVDWPRSCSSPSDASLFGFLVVLTELACYR